MIFKFREEEIESAIEKIVQYVEERDGEFVIEIKKNRRQRSLAQNGYLWVMCTIIGTHLGITKESAYKMICLENNAEIIKFPNGKVKLIPGGTSELDTAQMSQFITKVREFANQELGMYIKNPDEFKEEELMKIKNEYSKMFY